MTYALAQSSWDRRKDAVPAYWIDIYGVLKEVSWTKTPDAKHHPLIWADRPLAKDKLKELWVQSEGKPLVFARLIEGELGVRDYES